MDTSWIKLPLDDPAYRRGVINFIKLAEENMVNGKSLCPCKKCKVDKWETIDVIRSHLTFKGFYTPYDKWIYHGKGDLLRRLLGSDSEGNSERHTNHEPITKPDTDMEGLLGAVFGAIADHHHRKPTDGTPNEENEEEPESTYYSYSEPYPQYFGSDEEEAKYKKLLAAADKPLYEGCTSFSKLSFILHLFHMKCMYKWSAESFTSLLTLLGDAFPQIKEFPESYYQGKKMIKDLGLGYEKIDACPKDCMLFWGEHSDLEECLICGTSRWKSEDNGKTVKKGEPAKVMRYFPIIPRLLRLYRSFESAEQMIWHEKDRVKDGKIRHPADASDWKEFSNHYQDFAADPRNVRLCLATDGFNPYRLMNTQYSTWPLVLTPYNLPPWLCMKTSSLMLSTIIPGKSSPGMDIDVYLQPLLYELQVLWNGVPAFDAYTGESFTLKAALTSTINDFPAYAMMSGWSTSGYNACPICTNETNSVMIGNKICFIGHRRWLPDDHPYRTQPDLFDGKNETRKAPVPATGTQVKEQQEGIKYIYGKGKKKVVKKRKRKQTGESSTLEEENQEDRRVIWTKQSILFNLPYWEHCTNRHNLDVMHIEKNVFDNLIATLMEMEKSRDDVASRVALQKMGIRKHLWLKPQPNNRPPYMPPALYTMSNEEKDRFLSVLLKLKVPDGYGSNLRRCVNVKQRKLQNMKSHDCHVLMQDILPAALRASKATKIVDLLARLNSNFTLLLTE